MCDVSCVMSHVWRAPDSLLSHLATETETLRVARGAPLRECHHNLGPDTTSSSPSQWQISLHWRKSPLLVLLYICKSSVSAAACCLVTGLPQSPSPTAPHPPSQTYWFQPYHHHSITTTTNHHHHHHRTTLPRHVFRACSEDNHQPRTLKHGVHFGI